MQKLLFMAPVVLNDNYSGVTTKIINQFSVFEKHYDAYLAAFENNDLVVFHSGKCVYCDSDEKKHRLVKFFSLDKFILSEDIKNLYIRYPLAFPQFVNMLRIVRPKMHKIVLEFPDFPYIHEFTQNKRYFHAAIDVLFRNRLRKYVDRAFGCSDVLDIYGITNEKLLNGTNIDDYSLRKIQDTTDVNLLCIAIINLSTGTDRILLGLGEYYKSGNAKRNVNVHIIGNGPEYNHYLEIIEQCNLKKHVTMHGYLNKEEAKPVFDLCDIGIGALALHRIDIKHDSTLKSREYGLRGMPQIAENKIDILDDEFPYVMYCPYDDSPINILDIISFYDKCFKEKGKIEVASEVRDYFIDRCDINKTMQPIIDYFLHS